MPKRKQGKIKIPLDSDGEMRNLIGGKIKRIRTRFNKSAKWVAEEVGTTRGALTQIENGKNNISAVLLWKIATFLQCDIKEFFPEVPDSQSLTEADLNIIASENAQAAEFAKRAFKHKKYENDRRKS